MDMDRRSFLKTLGLGAVALTVPQPLGIIAAKMEDLKRPPLHVGLVAMQPAEHCGDGGYFLLYDFGVRVEPGISASRHADYAENWSVAAFLRRKGAQDRGIMYLHTRAAMVPNPEHKVMVLDEEGNPRHAPQFMRSALVMHFAPDDVMEFWFVPHSVNYATESPNYPLPKLQVLLRGVRHYAASKPTTGKEYVTGRAADMIFWNIGDVKQVLLDRAKAIELGLVSKNAELYLG